MRRNENLITAGLGTHEQLPDVVHRLILFDALAHQFPGHTVRIKKIILRISQTRAVVELSNRIESLLVENEQRKHTFRLQPRAAENARL